MTSSHRIGYVGNFKRPWCTEVHVSAALRSNGHDVVQYQEDGIVWQTLAHQAREDGIDMLLWTRTWPTPLDDGRRALDALRTAGIPSVAYHLDRWWGLNREHQVRDEPMFRCDVVCTADGGHDEQWADAGVRHWWFPPGVWGAEAKAPGHYSAGFDHDVAFVGSWEQYHPEWYYRMELIGKLRSWYASGVQQHLGLWPRRHEPIRGQSLNDLYATAKVIVGDSCLAGNATRYWSDRIPETLGRGGFLIHPRVEGLDEHYTEDEHLLCYDLGDWPTLRNMIDLYRREPEERARIAAAGRAHVLANHTYEHRMQTLIDRLHNEGILTAPDDVTGRRRYWDRHGMSALFELRADSDDALVVNETWRLDQYRVDPEDVTGHPVIDCGAHVGDFTVWAALHGGRVAAVEPDPSNVTGLLANVVGNDVADHVQVVEAAVTGSVRQDEWFLPSGAQGVLSRLSDERGGAITVRAVTLDHLVTTYAPEGQAVVKLDIEGGEYDALGAFTRWDLVDVIVMEFHGPGMCPGLVKDRPWDEMWGWVVTALAEHGAVEVVGRPSVGGMLWWRAYR